MEHAPIRLTGFNVKTLQNGEREFSVTFDETSKKQMRFIIVSPVSQEDLSTYTNAQLVSRMVGELREACLQIAGEELHDAKWFQRQTTADSMQPAGSTGS